MPGPLAAPIGMAAGGALGGLFGKPSYKDQGVYGMSQSGRSRLGNDASNQLHGIYQTDPNAYWGGKNAWTTSGNMGPEGGLSWANLIGQGGPGGGGGGWGGGRASAGHAKVGLDISDPTYALDIPKEQEERLQSRLNEIGSAQEADSWRQMQDDFARGGTAGDSPAAMAVRAQLARQRLRGGSEAVRDTRSQWTEQARGLRNSWNEIASQVSMANAQNATQASIANAGYATQSGLAGSAREAAAAQFLMGAMGNDEDRMLQRYGQLNNMNMGWQRPVNEKTQQDSPFSRIMGGASFGGQMGGMFGGMFGKGGGGFGGGGYGQGTVSRRGNPYPWEI